VSYGCKCKCATFKEHIGSGPFIASSARPTRSNVAHQNAVEAQWARDMPAYKRLREEGLQPKHIDGSAALERDARDPIEITDGRTYGDKLPLVKEYKTALAESKGTK
jgi:hypothetical protein